MPNVCQICPANAHKFLHNPAYSKAMQIESYMFENVHGLIKMFLRSRRSTELEYIFSWQ